MRLIAGKVLLDQSMLASESGSHRSRVPPYLGVVDLSPARVGPAIATLGRRSFRHASLIAAATADRSVLATGHDFAVIPVMAFLRGRSHGRARGRRVVVLADLTD